MALVVKCPNPKCGKTLSVPPELAGKTVRCNTCGQSFQAPVPPGPAGADGRTVLLGSEAPKASPSVQSAIRNQQSAIKDNLIGAKIAHYRVQSLLGKGGMGKVYKAHNISLDKACAIKILPPDFAEQDESAITRFVREAQSAAKVEHTNVLPVYFVGKVGEHYFIEMQYVDGGTLEGLLKRRGKLPVKEAAEIIRDVAAGLNAAHKKGIIHRDIKPTNVMLTSEGHVLVMDFGLAKVAQARTGLTVSGTIMGTPLYMSPEQGRGQVVDHRSDIYSLGVMFYQLLAGAPPFTADSAMAILFQHQSEPAPDISQIVPEVPPQIGQMIQRMMAKSPDERYQSCGEIVQELNAFLTPGAAAPAGPTVVVPEETLREAADHRKSVLRQAKRGAPSRVGLKPAEGAAPKKRSAMPVVLALVLLLVLGLGGGIYLLKAKFTAETQRAQRTGTAETTKPALSKAEGTQSTPRTDTAQESVPPAVQEKSPWNDVYVTQAATGEKIPHPLSRKTYKQTLADGTTVDVPEGMVYVPAGEFTMGVGENPPEGPAHQVYLDAYFIGKYEVTNAEWKAFTDATGFRPVPTHWKDARIPEGRENHPAVFVSWEDIQKYCEWVSTETGRNVALPTEAQWEKAARGPQGYIYPWGNTWDKALCNNACNLAQFGFKAPDEKDDWEKKVAEWQETDKGKEIVAAGGNTTPIGSFPKGKCSYGCYDMAGNAAEWCQDWFMRNYYQLKDTKRNPEGPTEDRADEKDFRGKKSKLHAIRGGSWCIYSSYCRGVSRNYHFPSHRGSFAFRIVVPAPLQATAAGVTLARQDAPVKGAAAEAGKAAFDDVYVTTAATGEKIPHPLSRKTYKQTLADGTTVDVPEGMVYIPAGEFTMGEKESEHKVYLDAYFIGKYEVTNAEWKVFVDITNVPPPRHWKDGAIPDGRETHPIVNVSWEDAQKYCEWVSKETGREMKLPTEAQWEKAAGWDPKKNNHNEYPWGDDFDPARANHCWQLGCRCDVDSKIHTPWYEKWSKGDEGKAIIASGGNTASVGQFKGDLSAYGCFDMGGNVAEWVADWFRTDYYKTSAKRNPTGPTQEEADNVKEGQKELGVCRVWRAGTWVNNRSYLRAYYRYRFAPTNRETTRGFRCARTPTP